MAPLGRSSAVFGRTLFTHEELYMQTAEKTIDRRYQLGRQRYRYDGSLLEAFSAAIILYIFETFCCLFMTNM